MEFNLKSDVKNPLDILQDIFQIFDPKRGMNEYSFAVISVADSEIKILRDTSPTGEN